MGVGGELWGGHPEAAPAFSGSQFHILVCAGRAMFADGETKSEGLGVMQVTLRLRPEISTR